MALYSGRILVRRGDEINYDPEKLMTGEWALSTDKKIVRICVSPGETIRMATYDAFEEDAEKIEEILATCQSIQEAVIRINTEISQKADAVAEYTAQAKNYSESALTSANNAHTSEINAKTSETNAKLSETNAKTSENLALGSKLIAENKSAEAEESANNAYTSALSASNSANSASKAAEAARESEQASSLNAQEAEIFRDEAEQFRNEASLFTPDNYEELVQTATKTKERVDNLEENMETISSEVETNKSDIEKVSYKIDTVIEKADLRIKETASGENIHLADSADAKVVEFALYGKATQNGTPSPDNEVDVEISGASGSVVVKSCGKNLLKTTRAEMIDYEGVNIKLNENKSITINGTPNRTFDIDLTGSFKEVGTFILNNKINNETNVVSNFITNVTKNKSLESNADLYFTTDPGDIVYLAIRIFEGQTYNNVTIYPMLRACDENGNPIGDDTYEPYKETIATIPTPNGLAGIDVYSGGNYTDSNGQQRVCDVIVKYADGSWEKIEYIKKYSLPIANINNDPNYPGWNNIEGLSEIVGSGMNGFVTGMSNISKNVLVNTINQQTIYLLKSQIGYGGTELKNNFPNLVADIYIKRSTPIRTPLTTEEVAEIEKLCTFYSVTNIYNDADCGMKATYIVDAKKYIDNKIAELATAMVNNI